MTQHSTAQCTVSHFIPHASVLLQCAQRRVALALLRSHSWSVRLAGTRHSGRPLYYESAIPFRSVQSPLYHSLSRVCCDTQCQCLPTDTSTSVTALLLSYSQWTDCARVQYRTVQQRRGDQRGDEISFEQSAFSGRTRFVSALASFMRWKLKTRWDGMSDSVLCSSIRYTSIRYVDLLSRLIYFRLDIVQYLH